MSLGQARAAGPLRGDPKGTQHLFGLFVRTHLGGKPVGWQWIAVSFTFCRQANVLNRCFHAENQLIGAAPKNQLPELTWFSAQFETRIRLHPAAVESATCLQASRFSDAGRLASHILEASTEILHHLRPCRTVDTKSIEYRRGISRRRTSFASHSVTSQPIQDRQVVCFGHCQKALIAATLLASTWPRT